MVWISDGNGLDDHYEDSPGSGNGISVVNNDTDQAPDFRDIDSDDDGLPDNVEGQSTSDYIPPTGNDSDGDAWMMPTKAAGIKVWIHLIQMVPTSRITWMRIPTMI